MGQMPAYLLVQLVPADEVVRLREWRPCDAAWYAEQSRDDDIQRFTTDPPALTSDDVVEAIDRLAQTPDSAGFLIADAVTGQPLGTIAVDRADGTGHVSYWIAADARGRGAATHALRLLATWALPAGGVASSPRATRTRTCAGRCTTSTSRCGDATATGPRPPVGRCRTAGGPTESCFQARRGADRTIP